MTRSDDERWMREALAVAAEGLEAGELPIGAVVVLDGEVIARAHTQERAQGRLLVHAELLALDEADRKLHGRRREASLYTTVEPCLLCLGAAMTVMIGRVVFALTSPTDGATSALRWWDDHRDRESFPAYRAPDIVGGVLTDNARRLFAEYVSRNGNGGGLTVWASTLA